MKWAEENHGGKLVPFIALCLFAGIRPDLYEGEISKLNPKSVRLDTGVIHIEPEVSKVRMNRIITIQPNLAVLTNCGPPATSPMNSLGRRTVISRSMLSSTLPASQNLGRPASGITDASMTWQNIDIENEELRFVMRAGAPTADGRLSGDRALTFCQNGARLTALQSYV